MCIFTVLHMSHIIGNTNKVSKRVLFAGSEIQYSIHPYNMHFTIYNTVYMVQLKSIFWQSVRHVLLYETSHTSYLFTMQKRICLKTFMFKKKSSKIGHPNDDTFNFAGNAFYLTILGEYA
jgi:hypothetical protein